MQISFYRRALITSIKILNYSLLTEKEDNVRTLLEKVQENKRRKLFMKSALKKE